MWLALKRTVCFLRRVGNHSRRAAKGAASRNEFAYRLAPFTLRWMRSLLNRVAQSRHIPRCFQGNTSPGWPLCNKARMIVAPLNVSIPLNVSTPLNVSNKSTLNVSILLNVSKVGPLNVSNTSCCVYSLTRVDLDSHKRSEG